MSIIMNDFSLDGQFNDMDEFLDSILDITIPILDIIELLGVQVLSSYNMYNLNITDSIKLIDVLSQANIPEITKFKRKLSQLVFDDPYWEDDVRSRTGSIYESKYTSELENYCLAEALERNIPVVSFEHKEFKVDNIMIKKDQVEENVINIYNKINAIESFKKVGKIDDINYLILKYDLKDSFGLKINKNLFNELVEDASLSKNDVDKIIKDMGNLIELTLEGRSLDRLSDTIEGKLKEFRTSLSNRREIRIFYFERQRKIVFLNGFLKKTEETPQHQIDRAKRIMKMVD